MHYIYANILFVTTRHNFSRDEDTDSIRRINVQSAKQNGDSQPSIIFEEKWPCHTKLSLLPLKIIRKVRSELTI